MKQLTQEEQMNTSIENFISVYENAFSKEYCNDVVKYFEDAMDAGLGVSRQQFNVPKLSVEDSQVYAHDELGLDNIKLIRSFTQIFWDNLYSLYANKFSILKDFGAHNIYCFKLQKTYIGQGYHAWHSEAMTRENCGRLFAWILYLNDVEEGGETEFLYYPKRIKPKTGTLVLWPAGFTHTHRGNPPISNTKYIATGWVEF